MQKYDVILMSPKKRHYVEQINKVIMTYWKNLTQWRTKKNLIVTLFQYVTQT